MVTESLEKELKLKLAKDENESKAFCEDFFAHGEGKGYIGMKMHFLDNKDGARRGLGRQEGSAGPQRWSKQADSAEAQARP